MLDGRNLLDGWQVISRTVSDQGVHHRHRLGVGERIWFSLINFVDNMSFTAMRCTLFETRIDIGSASPPYLPARRQPTLCCSHTHWSHEECRIFHLDTISVKLASNNEPQDPKLSFKTDATRHPGCGAPEPPRLPSWLSRAVRGTTLEGFGTM